MGEEMVARSRRTSPCWNADEEVVRFSVGGYVLPVRKEPEVQKWRKSRVGDYIFEYGICVLKAKSPRAPDALDDLMQVNASPPPQKTFGSIANQGNLLPQASDRRGR